MQYNIKIQAILHAGSGLAEDDSVNTFYFGSDTIGTTRQAVADAAFAKLSTAFDLLPTYLAPEVSNTQDFKAYDMNDPSPRVPFRTGTNGLAARAATGLPAEVACCLSFKAAIVSGDNPRRRKGRVFIGPLGTTAMTSTSVGVRPTTAFKTALSNFGGGLIVPDATTGATWCVYSPTEAAGVPGDGMFPVVGGWIDDAFDTQRRRGVRTTAKTLWGA